MKILNHHSTRFYVYEHIRDDLSEIFYVGKGFGRRAYENNGRNKYWKRIVSKAKNFSVRIVAKNLEEELAFLIEIERIDQLKKLGLKLSNMTFGGEGISGYLHTDIARKKMSISNKGRIVSEETKRKLSEANKGRKRSEDHNKKMSQILKGRIVSNDTKKKISNSLIGNKISIGRTMSKETRKKMSDAQKGKQKKIVVCPYCKKSGGFGAMYRWHFNNCKKG